MQKCITRPKRVWCECRRQRSKMPDNRCEEWVNVGTVTDDNQAIDSHYHFVIEGRLTMRHGAFFDAKNFIGNYNVKGLIGRMFEELILIYFNCSAVLNKIAN